MSAADKQTVVEYALSRFILDWDTFPDGYTVEQCKQLIDQRNKHALEAFQMACDAELV